VGLVCAVAASLCTVPVASAKPGNEVHPGYFRLDVELPESHGYSMSISAEDHRHVELEARKGETSVRYTVLGRASSRRVDADFGPLGQVHIRLDARAELLPPLFGKTKRCRGERFGIFGGRFHGNVDFTGEPGVAGVVAHTGRIGIVKYSRQVCKRHRRRSGGHHPKVIEEEADEAAPEVVQVSAESKSAGRTVSFETLRFRLPAKIAGRMLSFVSADVLERLGRVAIDRNAFQITDGKVLRVSRRGAQPQVAKTTPGSPFSGSGTYSAGPELPPSWSGDLAVGLPGAGTVPLTGPGFQATFCRSLPAAEEDCPAE
jgi:hypothetical protein